MESYLQQVLLAVLQALRAGRVKEVDNLDTYVFGTCRNMVMDMRRGNARQRRIADVAATALPDGYEPPWALADRSRLDGCLEKLEARARNVVLAMWRRLDRVQLEPTHDDSLSSFWSAIVAWRFRSHASAAHFVRELLTSAAADAPSSARP
jgi:hypothetical protein